MNVPSTELSTEKENKSLAVVAIENGTVIDHIPAGKGILILQLLALESHRNKVTVGMNLPSAQMKAKDLIKIENRELLFSETSQIAIFAPRATINIIENYHVAKKYVVELPTSIEHFVICPNPRCITNHEKVSRQYEVSSLRKQEILLKCKFCEKTFNRSEINRYSFGSS